MTGLKCLIALPVSQYCHELDVGEWEIFVLFLILVEMSLEFPRIALGLKTGIYVIR